MCAAPRLAHDGQLDADSAGALAHRVKPHAPRRQLRVEPAPIVGYLDPYRALVRAKDSLSN